VELTFGFAFHKGVRTRCCNDKMKTAVKTILVDELDYL
jgi:hypothetical protein